MSWLSIFHFCELTARSFTAIAQRFKEKDTQGRTEADVSYCILKIGLVSSSHGARGEEEDVRRFGRNRLLSTGEQNLESSEEHNGDERWKERPAISAINCVFNGLESHILVTTPLGKCEVSLF